MTNAHLVASIEYQNQARRLECRGYRGHGPWLRRAIARRPSSTLPVECAHCGERDTFDATPNLTAMKSRKD